MKLFLQTSSGQPALVLWDGTVRYEAHYAQLQRLDYGAELAKALAETGTDISEVQAVIIDIGPGRLGATRSAVAFANGFAHARAIPVIPLSSFLLLGVYAEATYNRPCLVLRSAARLQFHWALVKQGIIAETGFSVDGKITPLSYTGPVVIAGDAKQETTLLPSLPEALWPGLTLAPGAVLGALAAEMKPTMAPVAPMIETKTWVHDAG